MPTRLRGVFSGLLVVGALASTPAYGQDAADGLGAPDEGSEARAYEAAPAPSAVAVEVRSVQRSTLHREDGRRLCQAPCRLELEPGWQRFGLSLGDSELQLAEPLMLDRDGALTVRYVNNRGLRTSGWVILGLLGGSGVAGGVTGAAMIASGDMGQALVGIGLLMASGLHLLLGLVIGIPMAAAGDGAVIRFD